MKKKILSILLSAALLIGTLPIYISAENISPAKPDGDGSKETPYLISSAAELIWFADLINDESHYAEFSDACAELTADIDLSGVACWYPIGNSFNHESNLWYTGTFDGKNHKITNVTVPTSAGATFGGVFGLLGESATIKNLGVENINVYCRGAAGGIAGGTTLTDNKVTISHCYAANVTLDAPNNNRNAGGIIGGMWGTLSDYGVDNCFAYNVNITDETLNRGYIVGYDAVVNDSYCYYNSTSAATETTGTLASAEEFASGKIAYLLNGEVRHGTKWYQNIGGDNADLFPVLDSTHGKVALNDDEYESVICTDHVFGERIHTAPTCTEYGYYSSICTVCDYYFEETDYDAPPLGHSLDGGVITGPSCFENGYITYICTRCGETITEDNPGAPAIGHHSFDEDGFCTVCGEPEPCVTVTRENAASFGIDNSFSGYFAIGSAGNLYWFADFVTNNDTVVKGVLVNDIVVNENVLDENGDLNDGNFREWVPMCGGSLDFKGFFEGCGHTISGLVVTHDFICNGFFAKFNKGSRIYNTIIKDSYFYGSSFVGGICAANYFGEIKNCEVHATVEGTSDAVGGICGIVQGHYEYNVNYGEIVDSRFYGKVHSTNACGGIVGRVTGAFGGDQEKCVTVKGCENFGDVSAVNSAGGIFYDNVNLKVTACANHGTVTANNAAGLGVRMDGTNSVLTDSYNDGTVYGTNGAGLVHTTYWDSVLSNCYNAGQVLAHTSASLVIKMGSEHKKLYTINNGLYLFNNDHNIPDYRYEFTQEEFASGEAAYTMNEYEGSNIWRQKLPEMVLPTADTSKPIVNKYEAEAGGYYYANEPCTHSYQSTHLEATCISCGKMVYVCPLCSHSYTVDIASEPVNSANHDYINGLCTRCGGKDIPVLNAQGIYEICSFGQLYWFSSLVNGSEFACDYDEENNPDGTKQNAAANAVLTADISMNGNTAFAPIGSTEDGFRGTFDGCGHTLGDFVITADYAGVFGTVKGEVKNLCIDSAEITSEGEYCGILAALLGDGALVENCCVINSALNYAETAAAGFIAGAAIPGKIKNSYTFGCTASDDNAGGIVGKTITDTYSPLTEGSVINCYTDAQRLITQKPAVLPGEGEANVSDERFTSGEITYKLNGDQEQTVWYQNIKSEPDTLPVLDADHAAVYRFDNPRLPYGNTTLCAHENISSQTFAPACGKKGFTVLTCDDCGIEFITDYTAALEHKFNNGICTLCGECAAADVIQNAAAAAEYELDNSYIGYAAISNIGTLKWYNNKLNEYPEMLLNAVLTDDMTFNENLLELSYEVIADSANKFEPIGTSDNPYKSTFDGNGHTLSGIYIQSGASETGFIGELSGGTVKNLKLAESFVEGGDYTGGICGKMHAEGSLITDCEFSGKVYGNECIGGIVGGIDRYGDIKNSKAYGTVSGYEKVGGIAGSIYNSVVSNCENNAEVNAVNYYCGGIFGFANAGNVLYCINNGEINGYRTVGGIAGWMYYKNTTLKHSYNTGNVSGSQYVGGIAGGASGNAKVSDCFSVGRVTAQSNAGGIAGNADSSSISNCCYDNTAFTCSAFGSLGVACPNCTAYTSEQFASGEAAYNLNKNENAEIWYQTLNGLNVYPVFENSQDSVYKYSLADGDGYFNRFDIDSDGDDDSADYRIILNIAAGDISSYTSEQIQKSDIDGDGCTDILDCMFYSLIINNTVDRGF